MGYGIPTHGSSSETDGSSSSDNPPGRGIFYLAARHPSAAQFLCAVYPGGPVPATAVVQSQSWNPGGGPRCHSSDVRGVGSPKREDQTCGRFSVETKEPGGWNGYAVSDYRAASPPNGSSGAFRGRPQPIASPFGKPYRTASSSLEKWKPGLQSPLFERRKPTMQANATSLERNTTRQARRVSLDTLPPYLASTPSSPELSMRTSGSLRRGFAASVPRMQVPPSSRKPSTEIHQPPESSGISRVRASSACGEEDTQSGDSQQRGECFSQAAASKVTDTTDIPQSSCPRSFTPSLFGGSKTKAIAAWRYPGFENLGNTCYMNSAIQCLVATELLSEYFLTGMYRADLNLNNRAGTHGVLAETFADVVRRCHKVATGSISCRNGRGLSLSLMKSVVTRFNPLFKGYNQHDAQEFLAVFLDGVHEDLNRVAQTTKPKEPDIDRAAVLASHVELLAEQAWQRYLFRNSSFLVDLFQGQLESLVTCLRCFDFLLKFEPFMYLSLPLRSPGRSHTISTLYDALRAFTRPERLADSGWTCPKCKKRVAVEKRMRLVKLPPILIIHYKRFEFTRNGCKKLNGMVDTPVTNLNMQDFVRQHDLPPYDLYGVVDHLGQAVCGHYTASCLRDGRWLRFDDTLVSPLERESQVINGHNYVLFYQRRDTPRRPNALRRQTQASTQTLHSEPIERFAKCVDSARAMSTSAGSAPTDQTTRDHREVAGTGAGNR